MRQPVAPATDSQFEPELMSKPRKTPGSRAIRKEVLAELNAGTREAGNLAEGLAVDFTVLMKCVHPDISPETLRRLSAEKPSITKRMRIAGEILLEDFGLDVEDFLEHPSDTVRGWAAYVIGLAPGLTLEDRLKRIRPLADNSHFAVREWAWMPLRPHIGADVETAIELLAALGRGKITLSAPIRRRAYPPSRRLDSAHRPVETTTPAWFTVVATVKGRSGKVCAGFGVQLVE